MQQSYRHPDAAVVPSASNQLVTSEVEPEESAEHAELAEFGDLKPGTIVFIEADTILPPEFDDPFKVAANFIELAQVCLAASGEEPLADGSTEEEPLSMTNRLQFVRVSTRLISAFLVTMDLWPVPYRLFVGTAPSVVLRDLAATHPIMTWQGYLTYQHALQVSMADQGQTDVRRVAHRRRLMDRIAAQAVPATADDGEDLVP